MTRFEMSAYDFYIIVWVFFSPNSLQTQQEDLRICSHSDGLDWRKRGLSPLLRHNHNIGFLFFFFRAVLVAYGSSQARVWIWALAATLHHSHMGSEPHLQPTPQLKATQDPRPTEWGQGSNLHPHGLLVGFVSVASQWDLLGSFYSFNTSLEHLPHTKHRLKVWARPKCL